MVIREKATNESVPWGHSDLRLLEVGHMDKWINGSMDVNGPKNGTHRS